jgi:hypothetical protein
MVQFALSAGGLIMTRIALACVVAAVGCASFGTEPFAQSGQTVNPVPLTRPSINTNTSQCQINCDTQAMNCMNSCVGAPVSPTAPAGITSSCNLSCSTSQLNCKQRC